GNLFKCTTLSESQILELQHVFRTQRLLLIHVLSYVPQSYPSNEGRASGTESRSSCWRDFDAEEAEEPPPSQPPAEQFVTKEFTRSSLHSRKSRRPKNNDAE